MGVRFSNFAILFKTMMTLARTNELTEFLRAGGLACRDLELLDASLCYSSHGLKAKTNKRMKLEFLGDSVWNFFIVDYLFHRFPEEDKGSWAKLKSYLVSKSFLSYLAVRINMVDLIVTQEGERMNLSARESILESVYESFVAAIYLSEGLVYFKNWQGSLLNQEMATIEERGRVFSEKTLLQEKLHQSKMTPCYFTERVAGPSHARSYTVSLYVEKNKVASAESSSIKKAEKKVAREALRTLDRFLKSNAG